MKSRWSFIIIVLIVLALFSFIIAGFLALLVGEDIDTGGNVAVIPIKGVIMGDPSSGFMTDVISSTEIISLIEKAQRNPGVKAIIFEINSPGGSAVASEEIVEKIKEVNKTTVSWIREAGASGAYWIASATDHIVANRMSITGSVGVIASYIEFHGFMTDHNITPQRIVGGEYKDLGSPMKKLELDERNLLQKKIDIIHQYFIDDVVKSRKLTKKEAAQISTGIFYLGSEAKDLNLIDELGGKKEAIARIEKELNITAILNTYKKEKTLLDVLSAVFNQNSFFLGRGIGSAMFGSAKAVNELQVWT